jgi:hypothetical protein
MQLCSVTPLQLRRVSATIHPPPSLYHSVYHSQLHLVEWVGSGAPVCEEQAEANSLEDAAHNTDSNEVKRSLLADDLGDELGNS